VPGALHSYPSVKGVACIAVERALEFVGKKARQPLSLVAAQNRHSERNAATHRAATKGRNLQDFNELLWGIRVLSNAQAAEIAS